MRRERFPHLADAGKHPVEIVLEALGFHGHWLIVSGLQQFTDALFHRRQIVRDTPRHLLPIGGEFNAADQVWRGLETDADFRRECLVERVLYGGALVRGKFEGAAHDTGDRGRPEGLAEGISHLAIDFSQAAGEHFAQPFFQAHRGEIREGLARNGEDFLLRPQADRLM